MLNKIFENKNVKGLLNKTSQALKPVVDRGKEEYLTHMNKDLIEAIAAGLALKYSEYLNTCEDEEPIFEFPKGLIDTVGKHFPMYDELQHLSISATKTAIEKQEVRFKADKVIATQSAKVNYKKMSKSDVHKEIVDNLVEATVAMYEWNKPYKAPEHVADKHAEAEPIEATDTIDSNDNVSLDDAEKA